MSRGLFRYFHIYVGSVHFRGFKIFNFNIYFFLGGGGQKTGLFWGSFLYVLGRFLKVKVQNWNICLGLLNFIYFGDMSDIPDIFWG